MENNNPLIGKTIERVFLSEDKTSIKFYVDNGESVIATCDADCCSYTWIENVDFYKGHKGAKVLDVKDLYLNRGDEEKDYEVIQFYGCCIKTDKGDITLDYRNSSNGYYGGWISWDNTDHYGGVYNQNPLPNDKTKWIEVE